MSPIGYRLHRAKLDKTSVLQSPLCAKAATGASVKHRENTLHPSIPSTCGSIATATSHFSPHVRPSLELVPTSPPGAITPPLSTLHHDSFVSPMVADRPVSGVPRVIAHHPRPVPLTAASPRCSRRLRSATRIYEGSHYIAIDTQCHRSAIASIGQSSTRQASYKALYAPRQQPEPA